MVSHASPPYKGSDTPSNFPGWGDAWALPLSHRKPPGTLNRFQHVFDPVVHFVVGEWKHLLSTLHRFCVLSAVSFSQTEHRGAYSWRNHVKRRIEGGKQSWIGRKLTLWGLRWAQKVHFSTGAGSSFVTTNKIQLPTSRRQALVCYTSLSA